MSMFSIASSRVTLGRATVCSKGYRFTTTRSIGLNAVFLNRRLMCRIAADIKQPAVNFWMQRLHSAIQHLREASVALKSVTASPPPARLWQFLPLK